MKDIRILILILTSVSVFTGVIMCVLQDGALLKEFPAKQYFVWVPLAMLVGTGATVYLTLVVYWLTSKILS